MNWLPTPEEIDEVLNREKVEHFYTVYVLWDGDRSYYVGATANYIKRLNQHQTGVGSSATRKWFAENRPIKAYWKIQVPSTACSWTFGGKAKNVNMPKLADLESLVRKTITRQNPKCVVCI